MSEFFLELFSEEIPANLQNKARSDLQLIFEDFFSNQKICKEKKCQVFSTPNRLIVYNKEINKEILQDSAEIRGPNTKAPEEALQGFLKSNQIDKKKIYEKKTEKGVFYFYKRPKKIIKTEDILNEQLPIVLTKLKWLKSMKWGNYSLYWGRPLKSILALFNGKTLKFNFYHLISSNTTFIDKDFEEKTKSFKNFKSYISFFSKLNIIIDNNLRRKKIENELTKYSKKRNLKLNIDQKLLTEVSDIVEKPNIIPCSFDQRFLNIPREIIVITMQQHQKYFPAFDKKENLTNNFFIVSDCKDLKGLIKLGNERVIEARLSDAEFFWKKNKSQSLIKQVSRLKNVSYFKGLGNYFDKVQRVKKLSGLISDDLLISKEKIEIASSICKVDLLSDLVGEFPELQGILGSYFAESQGFDKDICLAVREHYLPIGTNSKVPKKPYSLALSLSDKLDSLVGFFGIDLKPTSSKDPYALRRLANGLIKMILENSKQFKIKDLINFSCQLYREQSINFDTKQTQDELVVFFNERFKNYMKEKGIRQDIIESSTHSYNIDNILKIYKKALIFNKIATKEIGINLIFSYKRASNILNNELKNTKLDVVGSADPGLFKNDYEKNLFKKIKQIKKDFTNVSLEDNYESLFEILGSIRKEITEFFDNVIVNDEDEALRKNRLELLQMVCKTYDSYFNFSSVESV